MEQEVRKIVEPLILHAGMELVNVEYMRGPSGRTLRIIIDKPGGVSLDDCAYISRMAGDLLDVRDPVPGHYNLEVSSPGINRPLVKKDDFKRFLGEKIYVKTRTMTDGRRRYRGILEKVEENTVYVRAQDGLFSVPFDNILRARLDII